MAVTTKQILKFLKIQLVPSADNIQVTLDFSSSSPSAKGWIDYIEINAQRDLKMYGSQMSFRSFASVQSNSVSEFQLSNTNSSTRIWDVTQALNPQSIVGQSSNSVLSFKIPTDTLRQFIAFNGGYLSANLLGKVDNQDLHALRDIDYLIVSHPKFWNKLID